MVRKIKAKLVLRLRSEGLTGRQIAEQGMSRTSVAMVIDAADREGIGWDDVAALEEAEQELRAQPIWEYPVGTSAMVVALCDAIATTRAGAWL